MQCQVLPFRQQKNNKMITSMLMNTPTKTHVSVWFSGQIRSVVIGRAVVINELFKKCNQTYRSQFQSSRNCKYSAYLLQNSTTTIKIRCSFLKGLHVLKLLMLITICSQLHSMFKKKKKKNYLLQDDSDRKHPFPIDVHSKSTGKKNIKFINRHFCKTH